MNSQGIISRAFAPLRLCVTISVALSCSVNSGVVPALAQQSTPPPPGPSRPFVTPTITEKTLPNGLLVVMAPTRGIPKLTAVLAIRASSSAEREKHPGLSQMCAGLLTEGTDTRTSRQIKEELRSMGASLGSGSDQDQTTISGSTLSEFSGRYFDLMSDVAQHPAFPETEVTLAKDNAIQGLKQQRSDPNFLGNERFQKAVFGDHPYGFVTANEKEIGAITRGDLKSFAAQYYVPGNAYLIVVGDIDVDRTFAEISKSFGTWKGATAPAEASPVPPQRDRRQIAFVNRPGSIQSVIVIGNSTFPRRDPDYIPVRTANIIYCGSFYSRLTKNIREDKGYTYSPNSSLSTYARGGSFSAGASVRNEVTGPTLLEMFYELDKMRVLPVSAEELANAKTFSKGAFALELANQNALAFRLSTVYAYGLPRDFIATFPQKIDALTADDIERVAAKYFDTYRCAVVIVGDWEKVRDQVTPFGEVTLYDAEGNVMPKP